MNAVGDDCVNTLSPKNNGFQRACAKGSSQSRNKVSVERPPRQGSLSRGGLQGGVHEMKSIASSSGFADTAETEGLKTWCVKQVGHPPLCTQGKKGGTPVFSFHPITRPASNFCPVPLRQNLKCSNVFHASSPNAESIVQTLKIPLLGCWDVPSSKERNINESQNPTIFIGREKKTMTTQASIARAERKICFLCCS